MQNGESIKQKITKFTELDSWKTGHRLVVDIFTLTGEWPIKYRSLASQMQRAAVSITSNIAEGFGRQSVADKKHFYVIARGSTTELQNQLLISRDIKLCDDKKFHDLADRTIIVHKLITGLIKSIEKRR
ncbi:MAG: four helix bundle protein [Candidatus Saccharimonadales bacterium]